MIYWPFQSWERIEEFQNKGNGNMSGVNHTIIYQQSATWTLWFLNKSPAEDKIIQGIQQAAQKVKQSLESNWK